MSFSWDWLLTALITTGIVDYYQVNVCNYHDDIVLYKLGRGRGPLLTEVHIIQRTSPNVYRVSSFDFDCCRYESFKNVREVCNYIKEVYIPKDCYLPSIQQRMEAKRKQRLERAKSENLTVGHLDGELVNTYESTLAFEQYYREYWRQFNRRKK